LERGKRGVWNCNVSKEPPQEVGRYTKRDFEK